MTITGKFMRIAGAGLLMALAACSTIYPPAARFEAASKEYNRLLRWLEFEQAAKAYVPLPARDNFLERVGSARGVRIVDYRIKHVEFQQEGTEALSTVELDYYLTRDNRVKTIEDQQSWRYDKDQGWQLRSAPPEFK